MCKQAATADSDCVFQHFLDLQLVGEHQHSAILLHSHDTNTHATMNMAVGNGVIAAGQDGTCRLMTFKHCPQKEEGKGGEAYCYNLNSTCCLKKDIKNMLYMLHTNLYLLAIITYFVKCAVISQL